MNEQTKTRLERLAAYAAARLSEASTLRALIVVGSGVVGHVTNPDHLIQYVTVGVLGAQAVGLLMPDSWKSGLPQQGGNDGQAQS